MQPAGENKNLCLCLSVVFLSLLSFCLLIEQQPSKLKVKVKYLRGIIQQIWYLGDQIFVSLEANLGTMPLSSAHSQLFIKTLALLLLTPHIICLTFAHLNLQYFACFCTINQTHSYKGRIFSPMAFTSCQDRGLNLLPPDGGADTLTTLLAF